MGCTNPKPKKEVNNSLPGKPAESAISAPA